MSCPTRISLLRARAESARQWMTFVPPILVSSLAGAWAPVARAGAKRPDVIWDEWEVYDHDTPIRSYLLGCSCAANSGVNDTLHVTGCRRVHAHTVCTRKSTLSPMKVSVSVILSRLVSHRRRVISTTATHSI